MARSDQVINSFTGTYRWLSNFELVDVKLDGEIYPSVEHAYHAAKTLDLEFRKTIQSAGTPGIAKRLSRERPLRPDWNDMKIGVMDMLLRQKFATRKYADLLKRTHPMGLIEGNVWNDTFWGVYKGKGKNHLGRLLMQVRSEIMEKNRGKV